MLDAKPLREHDPAIDDLTGQTVGRFAVRARLGAGGMGEVYRADDTALKRPVALKRVAPALRADAYYRQRLLKEAERAAGLSDPHIAGVYDVLEEAGEVFLVLEYVEGRTLRQRLAQPLGLAEFYAVARQCAEALVAAHAHGIVHRDLKPENIMVTTADQVKILDFGVAKRLPRAEETAATESVVSTTFSGTPAYMAPEVLLEKEADARADLFSLGVVFYEMLTGSHPFRAGSFAATSDRILHEEPRAIAVMNPNVPAPLASLVARLLTKDPIGRYGSAAELLAELRALERGEAPGERVSLSDLRMRRRRLLWAGLAFVAMALLLAGGWYTLRGPAALPIGRGVVLVGDFDNRTGDPVFDRTLRELLTTSLEQSPHLNVFPSSRLPEVLRRMRRDPASRLDEATGLEICQREGLRALVTGSISRLGESYVLVVRAVSCEGTSLASAEGSAARPEGVAATLDAAARQLRVGLGESMKSVEAASLPLAQVTSASLEAVKSYTLGKSQLYAGNPREAVLHFTRAVALDPEFAMAHEYLGVANWHLGDMTRAREHLYRATQLADRVTERERHKILGDYAAVIQDYDACVAHYQTLAQLQSDDVAVHVNLGVCYLGKFDFERAIAETETAVRLRPEPGPKASLAQTYFLGGRTAQARALAEELLRSHLDDERALVLLARCRAVEGDFAGAAEAFETFAQRGDRQESTARTFLADVAMAQGRHREARRHLETGLRIDEKLKDSEGERVKKIALATLLSGEAAWPLVGEVLATLSWRANDYLWRMQAGVLHARGRQFSRAEEARRALERAAEREGLPFLRSWALLVKSELALAHRDFPAAVEAAERAVQFHNSPDANLVLARAYAAAGRTPEAIRQYEILRGRRNELWFSEAVEAEYRLGGLYAERGDAARARAHLQQFLRAWSAADSDSALYQDAQNLARRLGLMPAPERGTPTPAR
jgi:tetratricopeptide (TPR) repeat protein